LLAPIIRETGLQRHTLKERRFSSTTVRESQPVPPFFELTGETVELTVVQRIWGLIMKVINVIAEFLSCEPFELTENVINNNHQIKAVKMAIDRLDLAAAAA